MGWVENTSSSRTKNEHENARENGDFAVFLRSLVVKTSKNAFLQTITKISYFKICYYHPLTGGSEWHMRMSK
jgi:hypothetical protein